MIVIFGILGVSLNPLILILAFAVMLLNLIVNIANKHKYRNVWIMQCQRCKKEFTVSDPDKMKKRDRKSLEKQTKQAERELSKKEKEEHRRAVQLEKSQKCYMKMKHSYRRSIILPHIEMRGQRLEAA